MSKNIFLGFDNGAGDNKWTWINNNRVTQNKESSLVARAPLSADDMPLMNGKRYYVGEDALYANSENIIDITGYDTLEETAPLSFWSVLQNGDVNIEDIDMIAIGLSFAHFDNAAQFMKKMKKFKINKETFDLSEKIILVPQGVGAKYTIEDTYDNLPHAYLIIDLGFLTADSVDVIGGNVRRENVSAEENVGVIRIARELQHYISKKFNDHITAKEAKEVLTSKTYFTGGTDHDLSDIITEMSKEYTAFIMDFMEKKHQREFKKYKKIFFVGGGANFILPDRGSIEVIKDPEYANSNGYAIKARQTWEEKNATSE